MEIASRCRLSLNLNKFRLHIRLQSTPAYVPAFLGLWIWYLNRTKCRFNLNVSKFRLDFRLKPTPALSEGPDEMISRGIF